MRLTHLRIERFRGILSLDWIFSDRLTCLIGPGDSAKTTVLEAVALLGSTRTAGFSDYDFFGATGAAGSIVIEGVFADLPDQLLADNRFGLELMGVDADGTLHDEPGDHEAAIRVRLDVDSSLEPVWRVISTRSPDGRPLTARDRAALGISRLGDSPERQFNLARGSALARAIAQPDDVAEVLAEAYRSAQSAVRGTDLTALDPAVQLAAKASTQVGAGDVADTLGISLEVSPTAAGGLTLHSGAIPVRRAGLGTRRLVALGVELGSNVAGGVVCIDELEHGLEPHRIRHLVRSLRTFVTRGDGFPSGHVLFTSHSPVILSELGHSGLAVVHNRGGNVEIREVPAELTAVVRAAPEAFLAQKVVIGEGKTEAGLVRAHDRYWAVGHNSEALAQRGVAVIEGGGNEAPKRAVHLAGLGFDVLLLADSDVPLDPDVPALEAAGVTVVAWEGAVCTERRIVTDLSWEGLRRVVEFVVGDPDRTSVSVVNAIVASFEGSAALARLGIDRTACGNDLDSLRAAGLDEREIRQAIASAAVKRKWFKRIDTGEVLGEILASDEAAASQPSGRAMSAVESFCYA
jgi:putative ATP-dependent endonuclease of OLD family